MPVYPQHMYREIDRKWLERTEREKASQRLVSKVLGDTLKERSMKRRGKRIAKSGQLLSMTDQLGASKTPLILKEDLLLPLVQE